MVRDYLRRLYVAEFPKHVPRNASTCTMSMKKAFLGPPLGELQCLRLSKHIKDPEKYINRRKQHFPDILTQLPLLPLSQ